VLSAVALDFPGLAWSAVPAFGSNLSEVWVILL